MQDVSNEYKKNIKNNLRERAYIKLCFGLLNRDIQEKAKIEDNGYTYYSKLDKLFDHGESDKLYATFEPNFTKVDGSMFFLPKKKNIDVEPLEYRYYNIGLVSENLIYEKPFDVKINFNINPTDFYGMIIEFGENYPVDFDILSDSGQLIRVRNNQMSNFVTYETFYNTSKITLTFYRMLLLKTRLHISYIIFGYSWIYTNENVISSSMESYCSPIGESIPQIDFTVTLKNYNHSFSIDNQSSAIHFLETGQTMRIDYGYQLPDSPKIEWITGNNLLCSEWELDDSTVTIHCHDIFRNMDKEYYFGEYEQEKKSYYDLAMDVLETVGISEDNCELDPCLKKLYSTNPIPKVSCKQALQLIANACRCILMQSRDGKVHIRSNFNPDMTVSSTDEGPYSDVKNILNNTIQKHEYATFDQNYTIVDASMHFLPQNLSDIPFKTGFISKQQSNDKREFKENPKITIEFGKNCTYYGIKLEFGQALPSEFIVKIYNEKGMAESYLVNTDIDDITFVKHYFHNFNKMEIEFTKTKNPYNRIVLNNFSLGDITDFVMTKNDMTSLPKTIKKEEIKEIVVTYCSYRKPKDDNAVKETLFDKEITAKANQQSTFYFDSVYYNFSIAYENEKDARIIKKGSYHVIIEFQNDTTLQLRIYGHRCEVIEQQEIVALRDKGKTIKWENPLISDRQMAQDLAEWLKDYYSTEIEYEYTTRGNPELDVNDIIYQENQFKPDMQVRVYRTTLDFNQSFSGKVTARRVSDVEYVGRASN